MKPMKEDIPQILIVDDISVNVEIIRAIVEKEGYKAMCALSVSEAIDLMKTSMPSLILSDLSMPEIDGLQFCRMVKSNPKTKDIPFIFISVMDTSEEKERAFLAGAVDFIPKPFERVEVIMRVQNQLNNYRMKQEMENYNRMMHTIVEEQKKQIEQEQKYLVSALIKVLRKIEPDAGRHLENVGYNSRLLAQGLQFLPVYENEITDEFVDTIEIASKFYDIGNILSGASEPDTDRQSLHAAEVKRLAEYGTAFLEGIGDTQKPSRYLAMAARIAQYRYARWDGSGHPKAGPGDIPLEARIAVLADDFDIYARLGSEEAIRKINEGSGTIYEPDIVETFNKIWHQMRL